MKERTPISKEQVVPIDSAVDFVKNRLLLLHHRAKQIFIHIGGSSGAGKSVFAYMLALELDESNIFRLDNYYKGDRYVAKLNLEHGDSKDHFLGQDDPRGFALDTAVEDLEKIKQSQPIVQPFFDMAVGEMTGYRSFQPTNIVIVEGVHAFAPELIKFADLSLFVDVSFHDRLMRRLVRDFKEYGTSINDTILNYFYQSEFSFKQHIAPFINAPDAVILNPSEPERDFNNVVSMQVGSIDIQNILARLKIFPKTKVGSEHAQESLTILILKDKRKVFQYFVSGRLLVQEELSDSAIKVLHQLYDFVKI